MKLTEKFVILHACLVKNKIATCAAKYNLKNTAKFISSLPVYALKMI